MTLNVSDKVRGKLDALVSALKTKLKGDLVSVLVHGSAVRGGWREGSDVDLVVVLRSAERDTLEGIANDLQAARWSARIETMVLVADEIPRAADVFPVFYDDIQRHHQVLHGSDPFEGLKIERAHLRLRVEQELREAQIRLRRAVIDALGSADALAGVVARKIKQVRSPLRALLALEGMQVDDDLVAVLRAAGETWKVDTAPLSHAKEDPRGAHAALVKLLGAAIDDADTMSERA